MISISEEDFDINDTRLQFLKKVSLQLLYDLFLRKIHYVCYSI